jgi:transcriptional regulator with XRE-family HTH domain
VLSLTLGILFSCNLAASGKFSFLFDIRCSIRVEGNPSIFMSSKKLPNYLRTFRKRSYLSQDEVAYLLGCKNGSKISRYERFSRTPTLETVFRYAVLFGVPGRDLFAGMFQKVEKEVSKRAQFLTRKINTANPDSIASRKLSALRAISGPSNEPKKTI